MEAGFGIEKGLFSLEETRALIALLPDLEGAAGTRGLLNLSWCQSLASDSRMLDLARQLIGASAQPVRAILFDKVADRNWALGWHQDSKIAVQNKAEGLTGFFGWSEKEGVTHVEPPVEVLASSVALRLHLDLCSEDNGPLLVIPESHLSGRRACPTPAEIGQSLSVTADVGDVVWMRSLLFHSSGRAESPSHRRVIHIEYNSAKLPRGLDWAWS